MIDDIVEMVLKEVKNRDKKNPYSALFGVLEDINDKSTATLLEQALTERRREEDENLS